MPNTYSTDLNKNVNKRKIEYNAREFDELKTALVNYAKQYYPNSYRDFNEASPGMMLIEMSAYVGDVLNFYIDKQYQEMLLPMAQERKNVINLARMLGYKYCNTTAAYVPLTFTQELTANTTDRNNIIPNWTEAITIPKGTTVSAGTGITFETLDIVDFSVSASGDGNTIEQSEVDETTGLASKFKVTRKVNSVGASTKTKSFTIGAPSKYTTLEIDDASLLEVLSCVDSNGNNWYEVDYLCQDRVPLETHYTSDDDRLTAYAPLSGSTVMNIPVPYKLQYIKTTKRFTSHKTEGYTTVLTFGNGIIRNGQTLDHSYLANQQVGITLPGEIGSGLVDSIDPTLGDEYDTLGETPSHTTLTITYRSAGGLNHNVTEQVLTTHNYSGPSSGNVTVTNLEPARGASSNVTTQEIKQKALANFTTQNRCVTREDYEARTLTMPAKFGGIAKVYFDRLDNDKELKEKTPELSLLVTQIMKLIEDTQTNTEAVAEALTEWSSLETITNADLSNLLQKYFDFNSDNTLDVIDAVDIQNRVSVELLSLANVTGHILCYDNNKKLSSSIPSLLFANLQEYLNQHRVLTDDVLLYPGKVINFGVIFDVVAEKYAQKDVVKGLCIEKIGNYFDINHMQFREPIYVNQLEFELMGVEGVRAVNYVTLTQDKDWRAVDTPDVFNQGDSVGLYTTVFNSESSNWEDIEDNPGYGYQYDFSQFYDTNAVGSSLVGDGIILPSKDPSVFELKDFKTQIKGIVR